MAKTVSTEALAINIVNQFTSLLDLVAQYNDAQGSTKSTKSSKKAEVEEEETELAPLDRDTVNGLGIKDLRSLAAEYLGDDAPKKKSEILEGLEEFFEDEGDEDEDEEDEEEEDEDESDEEDEDEEDEDEEDEDEGYDRDELAEMDLKALRKIAKENGASAADVKGLDQDALIDLIMGEDEEDEDEDDEEDEDEDEEVEELDEDALNAMSLKELKDLAKEIDVKVKVPASAKNDKAKKKVYVTAILESAE